ncbi:hypothetical protein [Croceicoccus marinus]|jgi:hypothetical protein|uniref:Uncharacterized protein n=1 Tax=Croceicoccus marinus TaxID=450378 RepID=A0A7G6VSG5_9SPHN|nr:hypothetical protein [Croceicoccus marinus]QNE04680.1 hypothetical protein H4O24_12045 [Croceicoccus marinus]
MNLHRFTNSAVPLARDDLESMLAAVIAMQTATGEMALILTAAIDRVDGDPDLEPEPNEGNGDEEDTGFAEDEYASDLKAGAAWASGEHIGPGCPISDPGGCEHDGREPPQYVD